MNAQKDAYIVSSVRTPVGKAEKGTLANYRPEELGAEAVKGAMERVDGLEPEMIDDVLMGCAFPEGPQGMNVGRLIAQKAGLPDHVPGATVNRFCSSGLQTIAQATQRIATGTADVIVAGGAGAFGPNRPPLSNIQAFEGTSVFYYVTRKEDFRDKRVVIAGGGDSAVDWALELADVAARVMVVHRRDRFRAQPDNVARMRALAEEGRIELVIPYNLAGLAGDNGRLTDVRVQTLDGDERDLKADVLLPFFGLAMDLGPIKNWGLAMDQFHVAVDPGTCVTSRPGIFAVGDVCIYRGKLKLITTGFAEAAHAAHAAFHVCRPDEVLHFEHSTTRGVPGAGD